MSRGADVSEAFHFTGFGGARVRGPCPERWLLRNICHVQRSGRQQLSAPGDQDTVAWTRTEQPRRPDLTELLREAEQHHGEYEPTAPKHHWSDWYAAYIVAREQGKAPEEAAKDGALHMETIRR